ncbi:MAG: glycerol-3-phosphate dehydrogenase [Bradyrhizobiaceae bacterium]|nr:MAG: glycerol-3-phosphate dehydrogenase [Bradyrhizobiaceae bacterium]
MADFDIAVIGGGLNGVSVAREAAGRGLRVVLVEQDDIGGGATAASPGLIHGSFSEIERGAFLRVRAALTERDILLRTAPHLVQPVRYVLPVHEQERPPAVLRASLFAYDRLAPRGFHARSRELDLTHHEMGVPLKRSVGVAFDFSDCLIDDSRLASVVAMDAAERGARIMTGARCVRTDRSGTWRVALISRGQREVIEARVLVNATGGWTRTFAESVMRLPPPDVAFERATAIVVRRLFDHDNVYVFQNGDNRLVYAIPHQRDFTLLGIVSQSSAADPASVSATSADVDYLCRAANRYFRETVSASDVVRAVAGMNVIPAGDQRKRLRRDGLMTFDRKSVEAPLLTIFGGASTTARRRAELAMVRLGAFFPGNSSWTSSAALPGGDFSWRETEDRIAAAQERWPFLSEKNASRLFRAYGTRIEAVLGDAKTMDDLGPRFGDQLTGAEVRYLMKNEFARFAEDILWRRSRLGLTMSRPDRDALALFMAAPA